MLPTETYQCAHIFVPFVYEGLNEFLQLLERLYKVSPLSVHIENLVRQYLLILDEVREFVQWFVAFGHSPHLDATLLISLAKQ